MALTQPCFISLTPDQQNFNLYEQLKQVTGFDIPPYDEIQMTYYGATNNIATVLYKNAGVLVATLTLEYATQPPTVNDTNLVKVTITYP
jgi:hypothetical protein